MRTNKKYTVEYKIQIVKEYLETDLGYRLLSQKHGINATQIKDWVKIYRAHGEEGLIKSKQGRTKKFDNMTKDEQIEYLLMEIEILKKACALTQKN